MATTPNLGIIKPVPLSDSNLAGATEVNAAFDVIDAHNHTPGFGIQIPTLGLNINSDLSFNTFGATGLKYAQLNNQTTPLTAGSFKGYVYSAVGSGTGTFDLFYNDGNGANIQLTKSGNVNTSASGNISGLIAPASASYGAGTFVWQSNTNTPAQTDTGDILLRKAGAVGPNAITLSTVSSLAGAYTLVLPSATPGSTLPLLMGTGPTSQLSTGQITGAQIAPTTITGSNLANNTITATQIANGAVGQAQKAAVPEGVASNPVSLTGASTSYTTVTSATVTLTGRPCLVTVMAGGSSIVGYIGSRCTAGNPLNFISSTWGFSTNGGSTFYSENELRTDFGAPSVAYEVRHPPGVLNHVQTLGSGSVTVTLMAKSTSTFHTWTANNVFLKVDEL